MLSLPSSDQSAKVSGFHCPKGHQGSGGLGPQVATMLDLGRLRSGAPEVSATRGLRIRSVWGVLVQLGFAIIRKIHDDCTFEDRYLRTRPRGGSLTGFWIWGSPDWSDGDIKYRKWKLWSVRILKIFFEKKISPEYFFSELEKLATFDFGRIPFVN